ncbi:MAG: PepSY-associated TM helix domain-containing protein [Pseudomonadota bacterium]
MFSESRGIGYPSAKAQDYHWRQFFGVWSAAILFVVASTATMISFEWSRSEINRVARAFLAEPAPALPEPTIAGPRVRGDQQRLKMRRVSVTQTAMADNSRWKSVRVSIPDNDQTTMDVQIDRGTGGEPLKRQTLTYDLVTEKLRSRVPFAQTEPALRTRIFIRYLHTGEVFGLFGQTVAALAAVGGCFLVFTGIGLSYRRFFPLAGKRRGR